MNNGRSADGGSARSSSGHWTPREGWLHCHSKNQLLAKIGSNERLLQQLNTYLAEDGLTIHQTLIDPDDLNDWSLRLTLDLEKSNEARTPVLHLESIAAI